MKNDPIIKVENLKVHFGLTKGIAKKRIMEVAIGLIACALFWVLAQLILPDTNTEQIASVDSISVNADSIEVYVGDTRKLGAVLEPVEALNYHTVVWTSSDDSIVETTKNGAITAKKVGKATITATTDGKSTSLTISVLQRPTKETTSTASTSGDSTKPIGPVDTDSSSIACATGTIDLGVRDDAYVDGKRIPARVCEVPTIDCTSSYSFSSNGHAVVNSRVSGAYLALGQRYMDQHGGKKLKATESYRTNERQTYFYNCYQSKKCNNGNLAARPGYSNHQFGLAIDFDEIGGWNTTMSQWFYDNAGDFGLIRNVKSEYWHVNPQDSYF